MNDAAEIVLQAAAPARTQRSSRRRWPLVSIVSVVVVLGYVAVAIIGPSLVADPNHLGTNLPFAPPSGHAWFGTDELGRDQFSRVISATRIAVAVGAACVALALVVGGALGIVAGYVRRLDLVTMRAMDVIFAFPELILAVIVIAAIGPSVASAALSIAIVYVPRFARIARAATVSVVNAPYVDAARLSSLSSARIVVRHVLPNIRTPLIVMTALSMSTAQLAYSALSFLGFGARPPQADFGSMLSQGRDFVTTDPWIVLFPGLALVVLTVALSLCGDAVRDALDPHFANRP